MARPRPALSTEVVKVIENIYGGYRASPIIRFPCGLLVCRFSTMRNVITKADGTASVKISFSTKVSQEVQRTSRSLSRPNRICEAEVSDEEASPKSPGAGQPQ